MLLFLSAYALTAIAALITSQQLIQILQHESYDRTAYLMRLKKDPSLNRIRVKRWLACLAIQVLLLLILFYVCIPTFNWSYDYAYVTSFVMLAVIFYTAMVLLYYRWKNQPRFEPMKASPRIVRLDISLFFVALALYTVMYLLFSALIAAIAQFVPSYGTQAEAEASPAYAAFSLAAVFIPYVCLIVSQLLTVVLLPRLLALASLVVQPIENLIGKRKADAAGRGMV